MKDTSTKELSEIICKAIADEPFFTKDVLIPKVRALIVGFRLQLHSKNYNKIETPTRLATLIRRNEIQERHICFWKDKLRNEVGEEKMKEYFKEHDEKIKEWTPTSPQ